MSLSQIALNNIGHLRRMKNRLNGDIMHVDYNNNCFIYKIREKSPIKFEVPFIVILLYRKLEYDELKTRKLAVI